MITIGKEDIQKIPTMTNDQFELPQPILKINANTREIIFPQGEDKENVFNIVQGDHKAETVWFQINRHFDGEDFFGTTKACVVQYENAIGEFGIQSIQKKYYTGKNGSDDIVVLGWRIGNSITKQSGQVRFSIRFFETNKEDKTIEYSWSTKPAKLIINEGLVVTVDNVEQNIGSLVLQDILQARNEVMSIKNSIPTDYTTLSEYVTKKIGNNEQPEGEIQTAIDDIETAITFFDEKLPSDIVLTKIYFSEATGFDKTSSVWASLKQGIYVGQGTVITINDDNLDRKFSIDGIMLTDKTLKLENVISNTRQKYDKHQKSYTVPCNGYVWFGCRDNDGTNATSLSDEERKSVRDAISIDVGVKSKVQNIINNLDKLELLQNNTTEWVNALLNKRALNAMKVHIGIVHDNVGMAIQSSDNGLGPVASYETSNIYECSTGDCLYARLFSNSTSKTAIAFYQADGTIKRRIYGNNGLKTLRVFVEEGEVGFRVSHTISDKNANDYVYFIPNEKVSIYNKITPDMFGAVGDNVTDDTQSLQRCFDYAYFSGSTVYLPMGTTYRAYGSIVLREYKFINDEDANDASSHTYSIISTNNTINSNIYMNEAKTALFIGENYNDFRNDIKGTTTQVNAHFSCISARAGSASHTSLFKCITFCNESILDKCKFTNFGTMFEASSLRLVSEIRSCTFYNIKDAFMSNKCMDDNGKYTIGEDLGFLADSKITNTYISASRDTSPVCFEGTHADDDALISGCFFEFFKHILGKGYSTGFNGMIFANCDFQLIYRFAEAGVNNLKISDCYFVRFSKSILTKINAPVMESLVNEGHAFGVIVTDQDTNGNNTESINFKNVEISGCIINECDNFINLRGNSGDNALDFAGAIVSERDNHIRTMSEYMEAPVILEGKISDECWSDFLNSELDRTLTSANKAAPADLVGLLKDDISNIFSKNDIGIPFNMIGGIITIPGTSCGVSTSSLSPGIKLSVSGNYNSYYIVISKDTEMWFDTQNASYIAFMVANNFKQVISGGDGAIYLVSDNPIRYRKSESNLPSEENKVRLSAGDVIAFTIKNTDNFDSVYGFASEKSIRGEFANAIFAHAPKEPKSLIQYRKFDSKQSQFGDANEILHIWIPSYVGYIRYDFVHSFNISKNADNWRINDVWICNDKLEELFEPCKTGEWECAIHLADRSDFSGGIAHGDEKYIALTIIIDGKALSFNCRGNGIDADILKVFDTPTTFNTLMIVSKSNLYDPNDSTTIIATHGSEHIFDKDGLHLRQNIVWQTQADLTNCFLAMFTPEKDYTDTIYTDIDYLPEIITDANKKQNKVGVKRAMIYGRNGFSGEFSISEYPTGLVGGDKWSLTDNDGKTYNKQYYYICSSGHVNAGDIWNANVLYRLEYNGNQ